MQQLSKTIRYDTLFTITYNAEECLQRTLDSVWEQTYQYVEHIIVDGASKDGTVKMAQEYKRENDADEDCLHDVVVVSEPDKGL